MVTPQELKNTEFSKGFKGYTCAEVDSFVEYVTEQYAELYRENTELEKRIRVLSAKLDEAKSEQDSISATIVNAQKMADEIIRDANEKANAINTAIKESFGEIVAGYREKIDDQQKRLFEAQKIAVEFKNGILDGYKKHVASLCELIPIDSVEDPAIRPTDEIVQEAVAHAGAKLGFTPEVEAEQETCEQE